MEIFKILITSYILIGFSYSAFMLNGLIRLLNLKDELKESDDDLDDIENTINDVGVVFFFVIFYFTTSVTWLRIIVINYNKKVKVKV